MIEININKINVNLIYIPTEVNTKGRFLISPLIRCNELYKHFCYYQKKHLKKYLTDSFPAFGNKIYSMIYNDHVNINSYDLGEMEYLYVDITKIKFIFFSQIIYDDCIVGDSKTISKFLKSLYPFFNCSKLTANTISCVSINKIGFFIFGDTGIKFEKISLHINKFIGDYLYFSFHTLENLVVIIAQGKNQIIFTSNSPNIIITNSF